MNQQTDDRDAAEIADTVRQSALIEPVRGRRCQIMIGDLTVIPNDYLPRFGSKQKRFPRSKKRRIRNKWTKKASSWRKTIPYVITGHRLFIHPDNIKLLKLASL